MNRLPRIAPRSLVLAALFLTLAASLGFRGRHPSRPRSASSRLDVVSVGQGALLFSDASCAPAPDLPSKLTLSDPTTAQTIALSLGGRGALSDEETDALADCLERTPPEEVSLLNTLLWAVSRRPDRRPVKTIERLSTTHPTPGVRRAALCALATTTTAYSLTPENQPADGTYVTSYGSPTGDGAFSGPTSYPSPATLSSNRQAMMPIVVSPSASQVVRDLAQVLRQRLDALSGATFEVISSTSALQGITFGLGSDFPGATSPWTFSTSIFDEECYLLRSHAWGLQVLGATPMGLENAMWDLLWRFGHRQFFPSPNWEVIPPQRDLSIGVDTFQRPAFSNRTFNYSYGYAPGMKDKASLLEWRRRNRGQSTKLEAEGHSFGSIIQRHLSFFESDPASYLYPYWPRDTPPSEDNKYAVSRNSSRAQINLENPAAVQKLVDYALENRGSTTRPYWVVTVEPNDSIEWGPAATSEFESGNYSAITDRVVRMANTVADAMVRQSGYESFASIFAYSRHFRAPRTWVHPNVMVMVTLGWGQGDLTLEENMRAWRNAGALRIGNYCYLSDSYQTLGLPQRSFVSDYDYTLHRLKELHDLGSSNLLGEAEGDWGPSGLAYYLWSRVTWDLGELDRLNELVEDFLQKSFGAAREPMREFYRCLSLRQTNVFLSRELVGKLYRLLNAAYRLAGDSSVIRRLDDLTLYVRHVELMWEWKVSADSVQGLARMEAVARHLYRIRDTGMIHLPGTYASLVVSPSNLTGRWGPGTMPANAWMYAYDQDGYLGWAKPGQNPWFEDRLYTREEIDQIRNAGEVNNPTMDLIPIAYSRALRPIGRLQPEPVYYAVGTDRHHPMYKNTSVTGRVGQVPLVAGEVRHYTWLSAGQSLRVRLAPGQIGANFHFPKARVALRKADEATGDPYGYPQAELVLDNTSTWQTVELGPVLYTGLYALELTGNSAATDVSATIRDIDSQEDLPALTTVWDNVQPGGLLALMNGAFFVPSGTREIVAYARSDNPSPYVAKIVKPDGVPAYTFPANTTGFNGFAGYVRIPVPPGMDGKIWFVAEFNGVLRFLNVPNVIAPFPRQLMLPQEVLDREP